MSSDEKQQDAEKKKRRSSPRQPKVLGHLSPSTVKHLEAAATSDKMRRWVVDRIVERALAILQEQNGSGGGERTGESTK